MERTFNQDTFNLAVQWHLLSCYLVNVFYSTKCAGLPEGNCCLPTKTKYVYYQQDVLEATTDVKEVSFSCVRNVRLDSEIRHQRRVTAFYTCHSAGADPLSNVTQFEN